MRLAQLGLCLALGLWAWRVPGAAPVLYQEVREAYAPSDVLVLDHRDRLVQRVRTDFTVRRGDWIGLHEVSPALQRAVISSEDRRFQEHQGVDWQAVWAAAWHNVSGNTQRGASTLSMQLVGFIDAQHRRATGGRSIVQKLAQASAAVELEQHWTKSQILEAYLNMAPFRGELVGIDALSAVLFNKAPSGLDARESALAAVLLRGPNASAAVLRRRACGVLTEMGRPEECATLADFVELILARRSGRRYDPQGIAPHFARALLAAEGAVAVGERLRTTLDFDTQSYALNAIERNLLALRDANIQDAAVVVLDNESGQVLAYVGSSGTFSSATEVDHARALRQAGSTLKPFLYGQALEQERLTAVSMLNDGPLNLPTGNGLYIPQNYDRRFSGWASVRRALASSLNIPAVRTLMLVTPDAFARQLVALGLPLNQSGEYYGYSLALGSADVTLLSLTNAYRTLARGGIYSSPQMLAPRESGRRVQRAGAESAQKRVMSEGAAWIVGDILSDRQARARTFGLDSPLSTPFWSAVKTGTSKDMRDNWCIGWSSRYTVGVWVGNSAGLSMRDVSGVSGAGPIWHEMMSWLHGQSRSVQPPMPEGVRRMQVVFQDDIEPSRIDYFIGDTGVAKVTLARDAHSAAQVIVNIQTPTDGTILALDPDIPTSQQRLVMRLDPPGQQEGQDVTWYVNGERIGIGGAMEWAPTPGRHRIEVRDGDGTIRDAVAITVRSGTAR